MTLDLQDRETPVKQIEKENNTDTLKQLNEVNQVILLTSPIVWLIFFFLAYWFQFDFLSYIVLAVFFLIYCLSLASQLLSRGMSAFFDLFD